MTGHQQLPVQRETEGGEVAGGVSPVGEGSPAVTRTYVVDTSVLLSDPRAMMRFAEHDVVLPVVVITELEAKRHHPELGYFARSALRILDDLLLNRFGNEHIEKTWDAGNRPGVRRKRLTSRLALLRGE